MSEKKKVLIVNDVIQYGGSDLVAVRLQQNLDPDKYECVYCVRHNKIGPMEKVVADTGVRIIHQPDDELGYLKSYKYYLNLFKKEHFDIVHCHLLFYSGIVLNAAKRCKIKKRVAHSHFSQPLDIFPSKVKKFVAVFYRMIMRKILLANATDIIGCSQEAGEYLAGKKGFAKKGIVLDNGITTDNFLFDEKIRDDMRRELGVENSIVVGHIGQMYYVKNHTFLIDVFNEYQKKHDNSILLLISDGKDRKKLEDKVESLGISDKVRFLGFRDDIPQLYNAMDIFVFPSIHEGFPLTLIEAQISKLPCLISDTINSDVKLNDNFEFEDIKKSPDAWCDKMDKLLSFDRKSIDNSKAIKRFDIKSTVKKIEQIYLS